MEIVVLSVPACPHVGLARQRLADALEETGVAATVTDRVVATEAAAGAGFGGSPTVLVDGRDLFPAPPGRAGLACRLYPSEAGPQGAPTVADLAEELRAAVSDAGPPAPGPKRPAGFDGRCTPPGPEAARMGR